MPVTHREPKNKVLAESHPATERGHGRQLTSINQTGRYRQKEKVS
jgi:hypothetical protein